MGIIDWRESESLENLTAAQALQVLGAITEALAHPQETMDADPRMVALGTSVEAEELRQAALRFHRKGIAVHDCRPTLRESADERRQTQDEQKKSPEEDAAEFAAACKQHLRKR